MLPLLGALGAAGGGGGGLGFSDTSSASSSNSISIGGNNAYGATSGLASTIKGRLSGTTSPMVSDNSVMMIGAVVLVGLLVVMVKKG